MTNLNNQTDIESKILNALFLGGLLAYISAATLSTASDRLYELLPPEEVDHVYDWDFASENTTPAIPEEGETRGQASSLGKWNIVEKGTSTLAGEGNDIRLRTRLLKER